MPFERSEDLGEIQQRAAQAIDLIHDDRVDPAGLDVGQQPPKGGPVGVSAGETAIIVVVREALPSASTALAVIAAASGKGAVFQAATKPSTTVETSTSVATKWTSFPLIWIVNVSPTSGLEGVIFMT